MPVTGYTGTTPEPGDVIERVYYCTPGHGVMAQYGEHETYQEALSAVLRERKPGPPKVVVDTRWVVKHPGGGGTDTVGTRTTYDNVDDAYDHVARLVKYAPQGV